MPVSSSAATPRKTGGCRLFLTEAGLAAFTEAAPALEATLHCQLDMFTPEEQAQLMSLLAKWDREPARQGIASQGTPELARERAFF